MKFRIEKLTEKNFLDYESLTASEGTKACYCSFWHQKITSMDEWERRQKETPELNRQVVLDKVKTGYHVGVLVYQEQELVAWISVGPLIDFYWTWKRSIHVGEDAKLTAGIMCFTISPKFRKKGLQSQILEDLKVYGKAQGWKSIEGYPFDLNAVEKQKEHVIWPGMTKGFEKAGFNNKGAHWLSGKDWERSIFKIDL